MNREIKFRGKDIQSGEWRYGYVEYNYDKSMARIVSPLHIDMDSFPSQFFKVDIGTISQFTGLHDKNGKMIYQHDIIQLQGKENKYNCLVDWNINLGAWCLSIENKCLGVKPLGEWLREDSFIVIGNIFDNPELLEE
jgi:uncharacterized phage protein (TIGR01671 family)